LGARTLNESVLSNLEAIEKSGIQVLWQTGKFYYKNAKEKADAFGNENLKTLEFIKDMDLAYAVADLTISRAGAMSISELSLTKMPAILVPSPNVSEDHQTKNAMSLVQNGAALLVKDDQAENELLPKAIELIKDEVALKKMSQSTQKLAKQNAAETIAKQIIELIKK